MKLNDSWWKQNLIVRWYPWNAVHRVGPDWTTDVLMDFYSEYADEVFKETGDTSEDEKYMPYWRWPVSL